MDEQILVVSAALLKARLDFQGFQDITASELLKALNGCQPQFRSRAPCEKDPTYKQLVVYGVIRDSDKPQRLFRYTRTKKQGEQRLHGSHSIGIGGHVNQLDQPEGSEALNPTQVFGTCCQAMDREVTEEVIVTGSQKPLLVGLVNDDSNDVGKVHLGLVFLIDAETAEAREPEDSADAGFVDFDALAANGTLRETMDKYETWSQHCLRRFVTGLE